MSAYSFKKRLLLLPTENLKSLENLEELLNTDWKEEKKRESQIVKESLVVVQGKALLPPPTLIKMKKRRETIYTEGRRINNKNRLKARPSR